MILADTSAWIEYDRGTGSRVHLRLRDLVGGADRLVVTEPVLMEILTGATTAAREKALRGLLLRFDFVPFVAAMDFDGAAEVYRRCRASGITPRGLVDCMIATVALRVGASVLAHDADFARIASVIGLELDQASLRSS
ncbi:MAG: PIN domain nuclease [Chloroflexota bacterium]